VLILTFCSACSLGRQGFAELRAEIAALEEKLAISESAQATGSASYAELSAKYAALLEKSAEDGAGSGEASASADATAVHPSSVSVPAVADSELDGAGGDGAVDELAQDEGSAAGEDGPAAAGDAEGQHAREDAPAAAWEMNEMSAAQVLANFEGNDDAGNESDGGDGVRAMHHATAQQFAGRVEASQQRIEEGQARIEHNLALVPARVPVEFLQRSNTPHFAARTAPDAHSCGVPRFYDYD